MKYILHEKSCREKILKAFLQRSVFRSIYFCEYLPPSKSYLINRTFLKGPWKNRIAKKYSYLWYNSQISFWKKIFNPLQPSVDFIQKPGMWFVLQIKLLVSILNATTGLIWVETVAYWVNWKSLRIRKKVENIRYRSYWIYIS